MDWGLAKVLTEKGKAQKETSATVPSASIVETLPSDSGENRTKGAHGTWAYMPREQAGNDQDRIGKPSDVFGLGAILCEILTGQPPYIGSASEIIRDARDGHVKPALDLLDKSGHDEVLIQLAKQCLSPRPEDRPGDAGEVAKAVRAYQDAMEERARTADRA